MINKTSIDLTVVLPEAADVRDACVQGLCDLVQARGGVDAAHLIERKDDAPHQLCVHHDPKQLSVQDVRALTKRAGAELSEQYGHLFADVQPIRARKARRLSESLRHIPGILEAVVSPDGSDHCRRPWHDQTHDCERLRHRNQKYDENRPVMVLCYPV